MSSNYERYAVAWVPAHFTPLGDFGTEWSGWCAERGEYVRTESTVRKLGRAAAANCVMGETGLHALLVRPVRVGTIATHHFMRTALQDVADSMEPTIVPPLKVVNRSNQLALVPSADMPAASALMLRLLVAFAPLLDHKTAPIPGGLFLPLSGKLDAGRAEEITGQLAEHLEALNSQRIIMTGIALLGDPGYGRPWCVIEPYSFRGIDQPTASQPVPMAYTGPQLMTRVGCTDLYQPYAMAPLGAT